MLVFNEKLLKVRRVNQIIMPVYEDESKSKGLLGYIYSDLETYRQAITLMIRFEGEVSALAGLLSVTGEKQMYVEYYKNKVPQPFKMFAPYLALIDSSEELREDLEDLISHLHVMGRAISFSEFITVPQAARINVGFNKTSFMLMKSEIKDYVTGLYEAEKAETYDGVYWVSSEEIERVGRMAEAITSAFGAMAAKSTVQVASSFAPENNDITSQVQREMADFEDSFDADEWADFKPMTFDSDFSALGGGAGNTSQTSSTNSSIVTNTVTQQSNASMPVGEDEEEDMDYLMSMAIGGTDKTNGMMKG